MAQDPMQDKTKLTDAEWEAIVKHLKAIPRVYIGSYIKCRHFLDAVLWILRVGGQWRSLPPERGKWSRVFKRFRACNKIILPNTDRLATVMVWNQRPSRYVSRNSIATLTSGYGACLLELRLWRLAVEAFLSCHGKPVYVERRYVRVARNWSRKQSCPQAEFAKRAVAESARSKPRP